ncbi:uncharacterized protein LOC128986559 isoform X1 [Macrosteles quadrilineatus]|uniref:uncharacterized protein LOC128986559 isoform X1 n=1 Tax=Macrosteles quadrilineatus TaxID=74068 RepID=UPI0023E1011E|nr:uncharacterized protein LOC128986559 isoform X1 [Macrosteles quadrilineatus]
MISDSESVYSIDSLEGEKGESNLKQCKKTKELSKKTNLTIPFYQGEVSIEAVKRNMDKIKSRTKSSSPNCSRIRGQNKSRRIKSSLEKANSITNQVSSSNSHNLPQKSMQSNSTGRISRRNDFVFENKNSIRDRNRSASYLDQFRKKKSLDSSSYSTEGSKLSRDRSVSFVSSLSDSSRTRMSSSELEFYDKLMVSPRNEQHTFSKEPLETSTLLMENPMKSAGYKNQEKSTKAKPIVLTRIEVEMPDEHKRELDKKKMVERRDVYANRVKLMNQIKINRQKEKSKYDKFNSMAPPKLSFEDCFLQLTSNNMNASMPDRNSSGFPPPSVTQPKLKQPKTEKRVIQERILQTSKGKRTEVKQNNKTVNNIEIAILQERHEREKSLIESLKNLYLIT